MNVSSRQIRLLFSFAACAVLIVTMQNCGNVSFSEGNTVSSSSCAGASCPEETLPERLALVYGADAQDRSLLTAKIAGYQAPGMDEIFNNWRRVSAGTIYPNGASIVPEPDYAFCFTGLDANGNWNRGVNPNTGQTISPGTNAACINSVSFAAASWSYLKNPGRLHNATNADAFNGFVSTLKFQRYVHEAVLSSTSTDDDLMGLIIAFVRTPDGDVHTLSAVRTQGGIKPKLGWALLYRRNNTVIKIIGEKSVGGTNCNPTGKDCDPGDQQGWRGHFTKVRVERQMDKIIALTSPWGSSSSSLSVSDDSRIEIDLDDPALGLSVFKGAQAYGYGIESQAVSEFSDISFNSFNDAEYLYDLVNDAVYRQNVMGGYSLLPDLKAFIELGYPALVGNVETQKEFRLNRSYTFDLMP